MKIAGSLTISNWEELCKSLDCKNDENWGLAFYFFEERVRTRYINPIKSILEIEDKLGEGFAVVNLQCSLIETIESFINGWIYFNDGIKGNLKGWFKNKISVDTNLKKINNNGYIFVSFFKNHDLFSTIMGVSFTFLYDVLFCTKLKLKKIGK